MKPADLSEMPFLFPDREFQPAFYDLVFDTLHDAGVIPRVDGTHDGLQAIWALVARGKGWALGFKSHRGRQPLRGGPWRCLWWASICPGA